MAEKKAKETKEPVFLIRPATKRGGLDYLHISLIALVIVLVALAFSLAYFKQGVVLKNCQYGLVNGTCAAPKYNASQAVGAAENILADYALINTSLSLLPYYSEVSMANASYLQQGNEWYVDIPYKDPLFNNETFYVSMLLNGSTLALSQPFLETVAPARATNNSVVSLGVVSMGGKAECASAAPIPAFLVTDPYAPGALSAMAKAINLSSEYGSRVNVSYKMVFTNYSISQYAGYGTYQTQNLGRYLYCSSLQPEFRGYIANLSKLFVGRPLDNATLYQTAVGSGLNTSQLDTCLVNSTSTLEYQARLAQYYGIVSTPVFVTNCKYLAIPQTENLAINYALNHTGGSGS